MGIRPRSKFKLKLKDRRCNKCGAKLHPSRLRCRRCAQPAARPKK